MLNVVSSKARGEASMSAKNGSIKLIAGNSNAPLAQAIANGIGVPLTKGVVRRFADMEIFVEIQENVRGRCSPAAAKASATRTGSGAVKHSS
jgi:ribose-phosphate pyrophosphokinase